MVLAPHFAFFTSCFWWQHSFSTSFAVQFPFFSSWQYSCLSAPSAQLVSIQLGDAEFFTRAGQASNLAFAVSGQQVDGCDHVPGRYGYKFGLNS
jgi:hypothetical protein